MKIGLVILPSPPKIPDVAASCQVAVSFKDWMISDATVPISFPSPVIPAVKLPWRETLSL